VSGKRSRSIGLAGRGRKHLAGHRSTRATRAAGGAARRGVECGPNRQHKITGAGERASDRSRTTMPHHLDLALPSFPAAQGTTTAGWIDHDHPSRFTPDLEQGHQSYVDVSTDVPGYRPAAGDPPPVTRPVDLDDTTGDSRPYHCCRFPIRVKENRMSDVHACCQVSTSRPIALPFSSYATHWILTFTS
jgi:hypothetical protein